LDIFVDAQGLVYYKFIPEGHTVKKEMYIKILHHFRDAVRKRPEELAQNRLYLPHNDAHTQVVDDKNFLANHKVVASAMLPGLGHCPTFFLFPQLKSVLIRQKVTNAEEVTAKAMTALTEV
jgi:hypothetical protein